MPPVLHTTAGPLAAAALGLILPHEHVFVEFRPPETPGHAEADAGDVLRLMLPELARARAAGVTALIDCTPVGVGRRPDLLIAASAASGLPIGIPTGIYREPWVPRWALEADADALEAWMRGELERGIGKTGIRAAFIKLSATDDGMTEQEAKILRAAARAAAHSGATIGSHTIRASVLDAQLDSVEASGYTAERFIWIHASADDLATNIAAARRGAWIEYDWIGGQPDAMLIERVLRMLDAGFGHRLLLSHDRGWYDPALPGGGEPKSYTYLTEHFLPRLAAAGVDAATIAQLTVANPFAAYAR